MQLAANADHLFTEARFRARSAHALLDRPLSPEDERDSGIGRAPSDFDLNPGMAAEFAGSGLRAAAVLVPVVARDPLTVILTQRTEGLSSHPGQIAFPGGKLEAGETVLQAALREAQEEIGLEPRFVEPLGYLDPYRTGTGFRVVPLVAFVVPDSPLALDTSEVAEAFEVPLAFLMDAANHQLHSRRIAGRERQFYAMPYGDRFIWGATAGILRNMHERLKAE